jgi:hypothetical protein|tara:strand:- start:392 stop:511 length:120 start_codon:yes stop_codon:yes gene_type:complete
VLHGFELWQFLGYYDPKISRVDALWIAAKLGLSGIEIID